MINKNFAKEVVKRLELLFSQQSAGHFIICKNKKQKIYILDRQLIPVENIKVVEKRVHDLHNFLIDLENFQNNVLLTKAITNIWLNLTIPKKIITIKAKISYNKTINDKL